MTLRHKTISGFKWTGFSQVTKQLILVCRNPVSLLGVESISLADLKNAGEVSRIVRELEAARIQDPLRSALFWIGATTRKAINRAYSAL